MKYFAAIAVIFVAVVVSAAQKGTAEPDYYPMKYSGDTWTGEVTAADDATREFTLTYKKSDKVQTFVGILGKGYTVKMKDGSDYELKMSDLLGKNVKVYYITTTKKDAAGNKVKTIEVFKLKFVPKEK